MKPLDQPQKYQYFQDVAMDKIAKHYVYNCAIKLISLYQRVTILAGNASFPVPVKNENNSSNQEIYIDMFDTYFNKCDGETYKFDTVFTEGDGETYEPIFYLDIAPSKVYKQQKDNNEGTRHKRPKLSVQLLEEWSNHEKSFLKIV